MFGRDLGGGPLGCGPGPGAGVGGFDVCLPERELLGGFAVVGFSQYSGFGGLFLESELSLAGVEYFCGRILSRPWAAGS